MFNDSELWHSEPLKQLMYCTVGIWFKSVGLAFILWPKAEEWGMQRKGITRELTGVKTPILHQTKYAAFLDSGSSTSDLSVGCFPCKVHWFSTVCWNSKVYWCLMEVPARSFLVIGRTSVTITIFIWCYPRILDSLIIHRCRNFRLRMTSKFLLFQLFHLNYDMSAYQSAGQCLYFLVPNLILHAHFFICICTLLHIKKTKKLWTVIKKYLVFYSLHLYVT
jgi:hypothetical protein